MLVRGEGSLSAAVWGVLGLALVAGFVLIWCVPPFGGLDEQFHWLRAQQISQGGLFAPRFGLNDWGGWLDPRPVRFAEWFAEALGAGAPMSVRAARAFAEGLQAQPSAVIPVSFPSTASFGPMAYGPGALALWVARGLGGDLFQQVAAGRVAQLLVYLGLVAGAVRILPFGRLAAAVLLTVPTAVHLATSFGGDPVNIGVEAIFVALVLRLRADVAWSLGRGRWVAMLGLLAMLGTLKLAYVPLSLLVLALPERVFAGRLARVGFVSGGLGLCWGAALGWNAAYDFVPGRFWQTGADPAAAVAFLLAHPWRSAGALVAMLPLEGWAWWRDVVLRFGGHPAPFHFWAPDALAWAELGLLAVLVALEGSRTAGSGRTGVVCMGMASVLAVVVLLAFRVGFGPPDSPVVLGLQGRYFLPSMLLVVLAAAAVAPRRASGSRTGAWLAAGGLAVVHAVVFGVAVWRYLVVWG